MTIPPRRLPAPPRRLLPAQPAKSPRKPHPAKAPPRPRAPARASAILEKAESSLLDLVDNLLSRGVVLNGELVIALADVDLVYVRASLLLSAADRVLPKK
jgi:hypothetical protein